MKLNRNLNTWLLLLALAVMVSRVLTPFSVPALVVHESGYIEICSWQGGTDRVLLDAEGNQVESEQPLSHCPECTSASAVTLPSFPILTDLPPPPPNLLNAYFFKDISVFAALPPPSRAPPSSRVLIG
ncbi:DUF2946 family protein [Marinospirillum sp.]|uniref:DUF2946 family protein n=1 Tax=Marinospirillum sp. TaxID=2183934 RepID=UPI002870256C|nr:DUF2946 family protein [Marinospirillum sp.]MDR9468166.1 hypothetical protein [Marinospirillum sp.]